MQLQRLKLVMAALAAIIALAWLLGTPLRSISGGFWPLRHVLIMLFGMLAIGFMSAAIVLAARPVQVEGFLGGLDKYYRLHQWLGIGALLFALSHWLLEVVPRDLVNWGWLMRTARRGGGGETGLFDPLRPAATELGEIALYIFILLMVVAMVRRIPYHWFHRAHRLMAPVYLVLVFHSVVLMGDYWPTPAGPVLALLMAGGSVAAAVSLVRRIGQSRKATGTVESVQVAPDRSGLEVVADLESYWRGHITGQFAFLDFEDEEGAHPFTISSVWRDNGRVRFTIKGIGDYTRRLPDLVRPGQKVTVEGPYGRFDFADGKDQVWIGGGVGITPFIARLEHLAGTEPGGAIDLYYSTSNPNPEFIERLRDEAGKGGVNFHLIECPPGAPLTMDRIEADLPHWRERAFWFCGPAGFADAIRKAAVARGLPAAQFHQELFEMR